MLKVDRIELDSAGFKELLLSNATKKAVEAEAKRVAGNAGDGFYAVKAKHMRYGGGRMGATVRSKASVSDADRKLLKAVT